MDKSRGTLVRSIAGALSRVASAVERNPRIRRQAVLWLDRIPGVKALLRRAVISAHQVHAGAPRLPVERQLSPHAAAIHARLTAEIRRRSKEFQ